MSLDDILRVLLVVFVLFILTLLPAVPLPFPHWERIAPFLLLPAIVWCAPCQHHITFLLITAAMGFLSDVVKNQMLGVDAAVLVIIFLASRHHLTGHRNLSFGTIWVWVAILAALDHAVRYGFIAVISFTFHAPTTALVQYLLTVLSYPLIAGILRMIIPLTRSRHVSS